MSCPDDRCPPVCESVFDRVVVSYLVSGGAKISWELLQTFTDPNPLSFQLQVAQARSTQDEDWVDVGLPVENQYYAIDPDQRVWGKTQWTHYRVVVTSPLGTYASAPTFGMGTLDERDWRIAAETVRQRQQFYRVGPGGQRGYLLKQRRTGVVCPTCIDLQTRESRDPDCPDCFGTGFQAGYYYPLACVWASIDPKTYRAHLSGGQQRNLINDIVVKADMLNLDLMGEEDVWVSAKTDDRYYVHTIQNTSEYRGVPITANVELRPAPFSSIIYTIPIPAQLVELE